MKKSLTIKNIILIIVLGFAGQLCWNMENQWFNTYVYAKIFKSKSNKKSSGGAPIVAQKIKNST